MDISYDALMARTEERGECLEWIGPRSSLGYGQVREGGAGSRRRLVHRLIYQYRHGPIPPGLFVCHTCDNPPCLRDEHHFLGTARDNAVDMVTKGRAVDNRGERHGSSKLTESAVLAIRARRATGAKLAEINRQRWRHVA